MKDFVLDRKTNSFKFICHLHKMYIFPPVRLYKHFIVQLSLSCTIKCLYSHTGGNILKGYTHIIAFHVWPAENIAHCVWYWSQIMIQFYCNGSSYPLYLSNSAQYLFCLKLLQLWPTYRCSKWPHIYTPKDSQRLLFPFFNE